MHHSHAWCAILMYDTGGPRARTEPASSRSEQADALARGLDPVPGGKTAGKCRKYMKTSCWR